MTTSTILKSDVLLTLLDSISVFTPAQFNTLTPNLYDAVDATTEGPFNSTFLDINGNRFLVVGYENFYAPYANVFPSLVMYNTTNNTLVETSRVTATLNTGSSNTVISSNPNALYAIQSTYTALSQEGAFGQNAFNLNFFSFNDQGIINPTPITYNMNIFNQNLYTSTVAYNAVSTISDDSKYAIVTYATANNTGGIDEQYIQIVQVNTNLTIVPKASILTPNTNIPGLVSFPQYTKMYRQKCNPSVYNIVSAMDSWNIPYITGLTAQVAYYTYDSVADVLTLIGTVWVSEYIQGFDVDINNGVAFTITNLVSNTGISVAQAPNSPYNNPAVDKSYELKAYIIDENVGIRYVGGAKLDRDGFQVKFSHNGNILAVTSAPVGVNDLFATTINPVAPYANRYAPAIVQTFTVKRIYDSSDRIVAVNIKEQDTRPTSPLSFGLAWSRDDSLLAVSGQATYRQISTDIVGQKSNQLYQISSTVL